MQIRKSKFEGDIQLFYSLAYKNTPQRQYILFGEAMRELMQSINERDFSQPYSLSNQKEKQIIEKFWENLFHINRSQNYIQLIGRMIHFLKSEDFSNFQNLMETQRNIFMCNFRKVSFTERLNFSQDFIEKSGRQPCLRSYMTWNNPLYILRKGFQYCLSRVHIPHTEYQVFQKQYGISWFDRFQLKVEKDVRQIFHIQILKVDQKQPDIFVLLPFLSFANCMTKLSASSYFAAGRKKIQLMQYFQHCFEEFWEQFQKCFHQEISEEQFVEYLQQEKVREYFDEKHVFRKLQYYCNNAFDVGLRFSQKIYYDKQTLLEQTELHHLFYETEANQFRDLQDTANETNFEESRGPYPMGLYLQKEKCFIVKCLKNNKFKLPIYQTDNNILFPGVIIRKCFYIVELFYLNNLNIERLFEKHQSYIRSFLFLESCQIQQKQEQIKYFKAKVGINYKDYFSKKKIGLQTVVFLFKYLLGFIKLLDIRVIKIGE